MPTNLGRARAEELQVTGKAKASQVEGAHVLIGKERPLVSTLGDTSLGAVNGDVHVASVGVTRM